MVLINAGRDGRSSKVVERRGDLHSRTVAHNKILKQEELHIASKVLKEIKETGIPRQDFAQGTVFVVVVTPNA
jgi:hypothetical protein